MNILKWLAFYIQATWLAIARHPGTRPRAYSARLLPSGFAVCLLLSVLAPAHAAVRLPDGEFSNTVTDLTVKVMGGYTTQKHTWYKNSLHFNRQWASLILTYDNLDGSIKTIERNGDIYAKSNEQGTLFKFGKRNSIAITETGFRWQDRQGNWITYTGNGVISAYGDRNLTQATMEYNALGQLARVRDLFNRTVLTYTYLGNGQLSAVEDVAGRRVEYTINSSPGGTTSTVTDVLGNTRSYRYSLTYITLGYCAYPEPIIVEPPFPEDPDYIPPPPPPRECIPQTYQSPREDVTITDPEGRVINVPSQDGLAARVSNEDTASTNYAYSYDKLRKQYSLTTTSSSGRIEDTTYDEHGLLISQTVNGQRLQSVSLDGNNRIYTDRNGGITVEQYDEFDNLIKRTLPDGASISYAYDSYSNITRTVDENGVITKNDYDDKGNLILSTEALGLPEQRITEYDYDQYGNRIQIKRLGDANTTEAITSYTYDDEGNISTATDPEGNVTRYTSYDSRGNVLTRKDPRGKLWVYTYDDAGRLESATNPLGDAAIYGYDKVGNRIRETDGNNKITNFDYDKRDNLTKITDPYGKEKIYDYNHDNQLIRAADEEGKALTYEYDLTGRLIMTKDGNGNVTELDFADEALPDSGRLDQPSAINYPTFQQQIKYDKLNRPLLDTVFLDSEALISRYKYDAIGNVIAVTDRNGKVTRYEYDAYQRPFRQIDALENITELTYDNRDNVLSVKDGNGHIRHFEYDKNNRLTKETSPLGQAIQYTYDANNNLIERLDAKDQKTHYGFDHANRRITTEYFTGGASTPTQSITYTYDAEGYLTGWDDGSASAILTYDDVNRKTRETVDYGPFSLTHSYTYYANGQKKSFTGPDGITYDYSFDANNQLTSVQLPGQGAITVNGYEWLAPKKVTLPGGTTQDYGYDELLRASSITVKDPAQQILLDHRYRYDNENNVREKTTGQGNSSYDYDDLYRLTQADHNTQTDEAYTYDALGNRLTDSQAAGIWQYDANHRLSGYGDTSYTYDANGNTGQKTVAGDSTQYRYDVQNRLAEVYNDLTVIARYGYDPSGRRLWKEVSGTRTYFFYADEGLVGEYSSTGVQTRSYGYQPDSLGTTDPLFLKVGENYYFYQNDRLGTPQTLTDIRGAVVWSATLESFGSARIESAIIENNLRFPGQYYDKETGLHYNYFRDYDPRTGRYVESDPIGLDGGINTYIYVDSNPLHWIDPEGLAKMCCRLLDSIAGSIGRQRHCYVIADDGTVYGLYPSGGKGVPRTNDPRDTGGDCFDCPAMPCSSQNECLRNAHNNYPKGDYSTLGPNSNTYAGTLAKSCCKGGIPSGVSNAPGVNDNPALPPQPVPENPRGRRR